MTDQSEKSDFVIQCEELIKDITLTTKKQKEQIQNLIKLHNKEIKLSQKYKPATKTKTKTGFTKSSRVPDKIADFIGIERGTFLPRTKVTSQLMEEFKKRNLLYSKDKRIIIPNNEVRNLFSDLPESKVFSNDPKDPNGLNIFTLQTHLTSCYENDKVLLEPKIVTFTN